MRFLEMSPLAVVAILVVIVYFVMSSKGGRKRAGKSSLTGSLSKELQSIGKSVKKTTGKGGLGKITNNKMLVGILVGFGLCWAYGKFRMEGFSVTKQGWNELTPETRGKLCTIPRPPRSDRIWTQVGGFPENADEETVYTDYCTGNVNLNTVMNTVTNINEIPDMISRSAEAGLNTAVGYGRDRDGGDDIKPAP